MYADDLILLSPSIAELQAMIDVCYHELGEINLGLNVNKSACLRIVKRCFTKYCDLKAGNGVIPWVTEIKHLGLTMLNGTKFRVSFDYAKCKSFSAWNSLYSKLGCITDLNLTLH